MPLKFVQILIPVMGEGTVILLGMLIFWLIFGGVRWLVNWWARHPRPIVTDHAVKPVSAPVAQAVLRPFLPAVFRMAVPTQVTLCLLLMIPPIAATMAIISEWEEGIDFLFEILVNLLNPASLALTLVVYLLCPFTAWNIYWRRRDHISFDTEQVAYRSAYKTGKLRPARIILYRGRSWRFDLTDLFRGQWATSWFLEIVPMSGTGMDEVREGSEHLVLDLKAMNLGGSARAIANMASQVYGDKFLINNQLPLLQK